MHNYWELELLVVPDIIPLINESFNLLVSFCIFSWNVRKFHIIKMIEKSIRERKSANLHIEYFESGSMNAKFSDVSLKKNWQALQYSVHLINCTTVEHPTNPVGVLMKHLFVVFHHILRKQCRVLSYNYELQHFSFSYSHQ